jgi:hypothetical protein
MIDLASSDGREMTTIGPFTVDLKAYGRSYFFQGLWASVARLLTAITALVIVLGSIWGPPAFIGSLVIYLLVPLLLFARWRQIGATFRHPMNKFLGYPRIIRFDENRIVQEIPGMSRSEFSWALVVNFAEWDGFLLFFFSQSYFFLVPTKEVTVDDLAELRRIAKARVQIPGEA